MEQREGDPGDLAGHLGRGRCAEGERKGRGRPLMRGACGSASVRAGEAGERGTAGEVGAGVRAAGPERVQREAGRTGPSAGLLRVGVEMGRTCGALCWARKVGSGPRERGKRVGRVQEEVGWVLVWAAGFGFGLGFRVLGCFLLFFSGFSHLFFSKHTQNYLNSNPKHSTN